MEDLKIFNDISNSDGWLDQPFSGEWKNTYAFVKEYILNNYAKAEAEKKISKIRAVINILVSKGETYEDIVLDTALLYLLAKNSNYEFEGKATYSGYVYDGVYLLLDTNNTNYLNNVYNNPEYAYLNKIGLAELIVEQEELKSTSNLVEKTKIIKLIENVIKKFDGKTNINLMKILKDNR